jgi:hypothetical protein
MRAFCEHIALLPPLAIMKRAPRKGENWRSESPVTMTTKRGSIYVVDAKIFSPALLKNYRTNLLNTER